jgi:hypothetical protein
MMVGARTSSAAVSFAAALALLGGAPRLARAQEDQAKIEQPTAPPTRALPPIQIHMIIARASEKEGAIEPAAQDIYEHLPAKYHSVTVIEDRTVAVLLGEEARVSLPNNREVVLLPVAVHGGQLHLQLEMPDVVNTSMRLNDDRAFYMGGVKLDQGTLVFKLVPEFGAYIAEPNQTRIADRPPAPDVERASSKTRH